MISPPAQPRRLAFLGTPAAAVPPLRALVASGRPVDLVVTRPDRRRRRNKPPEPSPVKAAALDLGLTVTDDLGALDELEVDLGVVVAYGRIIPTALLVRLPMVNLHFSLLPRWRGAAPVERAILAGDRVTGVCVMQVVPELDEGPVYASASVVVDDLTADALRERLVAVGTDLLLETLDEGLGEPEAQVGAVSYAAKIEAEDLHLDWERSAEELRRVVRLGRAWTMFRGERLLVLDVSPAEGDPLAPGALNGSLVGTGAGNLSLDRVQPAGRSPVVGSDWANGARLDDDDRLGIGP